MNNKDNGLEGLTNEEKSIVALFGVINGAIQHPDTPLEMVEALSGSTLMVLKDSDGQFGFRDSGTELGDTLERAILHNMLQAVMRRERVKQGSDILKDLNLN